jgi:hypothetical protein
MEGMMNTSPVGTWLVTPKGGPTGDTGRNLLTLIPEGPIVWNGGPGPFNVGHGAWSSTGERSARLTILVIDRGTRGEVIGLGRTDADLRFDPTFDQFDASVVTEHQDPQGQRLDSVTFSSHGVRVKVRAAP